MFLPVYELYPPQFQRTIHFQSQLQRANTTIHFYVAVTAPYSSCLQKRVSIKKKSSRLYRIVLFNKLFTTSNRNDRRLFDFRHVLSVRETNQTLNNHNNNLERVSKISAMFVEVRNSPNNLRSKCHVKQYNQYFRCKRSPVKTISIES